MRDAPQMYQRDITLHPHRKASEPLYERKMYLKKWGSINKIMPHFSLAYIASPHHPLPSGLMCLNESITIIWM